MTGTIGNHHDEYVAAPLAQKHQWMHSGKGIAATQSAAEALGQLVPEFAEHATALQAGMQKLGIAWSGEAATAATTKLQQAASWAEQAGHTSTAGHASVQTYGDSFANTVPRIPEPKPEPDTSVLGTIEDWFDMQQDKWDNLAENQKNDRLAVDALDRHERTTREAANSFPDQLDPQFHTAEADVTHSAAAGPAPGAGAPGGAHSAGVATPGAAGGAAMTPSGTGAGGAGAGSPGGAGGSTGGGAAGVSTGGGGAGAPGATTPPIWTPLTPAPARAGGAGMGSAGPSTGGRGTGTGGLGSGGLGSGGLGSGEPGSGRPLTPRPLSPPVGGGFGPGSSGDLGPRTSGGGLGRLGDAPPAARGGTALPGAAATGAAPPAEPGVAGGRPGSPGAGGMPMGGMGGGVGGQQREHRNNVFVPSDEPFAVALGDDVVPPVLDAEHIVE
jgi:hypothetical protein